jgi:uncharacterized membrane protein
MMRLLRSLVAGLLVLGLLPGSAVAQSVSISTAYPAVTVDPGGTASFPLDITTPSPERVDLTVVTAPPDWTTRLRGGGATVSAVYTGGDEPPRVTLEVNLPASVTPGSYDVVVEARSATASARLTLDVTVEAVEQGAVEFEAQYPVLRGRAGQTYRFDLSLRNGTNEERTFTLEASGPPGWRVDARPQGQEQAATLVVAAGATGRVTVEAVSPSGTEAGPYPFVIRATGGPVPVEVQLGVDITGSYSVQLATADGRLNTRVAVGDRSPLTLLVTNTGSAPLSDVSLSATPPSGWEIDFEPATIETLQPGAAASQTVTANIRPADNAVAGDYAVTLRASASDPTGGTASSSVEIRTTVETSPIWGFVGLAIIALVLAGLFLVFRLYGRR